MLEAFFKLKERKTNVRTELIAGITTFMTMAYIIFVNPSILAAAGVPQNGAFVATALAAAVACVIMGAYANYPFALASGMGLNAFLAYTVCLGMKVPWQTAMGVVFVEGVLITILVLTNFREAVMAAIPHSLKKAIGAGIGLFIAFIGLKDAGIIVADPATFVKMGNFTTAPVVLAAVGLVIMAFLMARKVKGSILIGILATTVLALIFGQAHLPKHAVDFHLSFSTMFKLNIMGALKLSLLTTIFAFMITDFFDTMGSVIAMGDEAGLTDKQGSLPGLKKILLADSLAAVIGGLFGASSVTTYIESASGIAEGGRTGLSAIFVGILFLLCLPFGPIAGIVPSAATGPALVIVGFLMISAVKDIPFGSVEEGLPAFLAIVGMPLTFSITNGIGFGFVSYALIKLLSGKAKEVKPLMWVVAAAFVINFMQPIIDKWIK